MRIIVIGASGRTGSLIVGALLAAGHEVIGTIRNPKHMPALVKAGAEVALIDLDTSSLDDIAFAMQGADAVVFAAGSSEGQTSELDRKGTLRTVRAAEKAGVKRYVAISAIGASTGMSVRSMSDEMKDYYKQKRAAGKHITGSSLDWTIIEPAELTDAKPTGKVTLTESLIEDVGNIPRADVAAVTAAVLSQPKTIGHAYQLTGGKTPIKTALAKAVA
ncbi:MAG TPA: SDR family oxidoreductase [Devosia sp.]|nr:SDR family oxidoreductase [Devosia sp.]